MESPNQFITEDSGVALWIKREDLIGGDISGNKFRKLKYNLLDAKQRQLSKIVTFGGAYSNHIAAVAAAGRQHDFETIGLIRGEELKDQLLANPTLQFAKDCGMRLQFISRAEYRRKDQPEFIAALKQNFGDFYILPEGGTNELAIKGCEEILNEGDFGFDYLCCAVGTGGTIAGLSNSAKPHQKILGFPALKGDFLTTEICKFAKQSNWKLIPGYDFGGYAKVSPGLIEFINAFRKQTHIQLDPVYTGKMVFGVMDMICRGNFPKGSKILLIHTGGVQGIKGMNISLKNKNLPLIDRDD